MTTVDVNTLSNLLVTATLERPANAKTRRRYMYLKNQGTALRQAADHYQSNKLSVNRSKTLKKLTAQQRVCPAAILKYKIGLNTTTGLYE
ncbi:hypothetical protein WJX72_003795 [[Myrmecia] bisecta]|uniref:Uncharacterized protein n=1 Tax=[Myrmecia] bisecta TaxID=41462 RepID=A0AAW1P717_9CHLO